MIPFIKTFNATEYRVLYCREYLGRCGRCIGSRSVGPRNLDVMDILVPIPLAPPSAPMAIQYTSSRPGRVLARVVWWVGRLKIPYICF